MLQSATGQESLWRRCRIIIKRKVILLALQGTGMEVLRAIFKRGSVKAHETARTMLKYAISSKPSRIIMCS
jgi:hypothetical protein